MSSITADHSTIEVSQFLKLLSDPTRLEIIRRLAVREHCVCDFVDLFGISQPAVSRHLKLLRSAGVILERRERQWNYFRLNSEHGQHDLLRRILEQVGVADVPNTITC
ncbi:MULTISPECIES: helix-turn-helix transcriptional regulator [Exiguobacterium]|uniref:ArsR/SmtB family transcription factor n=1 Tax=Exiguobacterium TaxID=33986 RepID=UPI000E829571|nr:MULTISPECIES: metalloregulator ArsR/SmtB family transcription factor [unclassified Exiguobacterium]MDT0173047.1 metalloregulator ArsR/SmtB family transcription factor [Exiguobacterium sp. BRG2]HAK99762.1 ArsR family transcriptional regulator [Exiguobacterium sp.]HAZ39742.1 ArsR family transcriptional regulator [Exiguobacterium sp.]HBF58919.1 ArsR family transcriptional regulator [Exiguobacterium sp.]HCV51745.1 ArsR family transcriptional regulator [Exiguobacterium sp.]